MSGCGTVAVRVYKCEGVFLIPHVTCLVPRRELGNEVVYLVKVLIVECCTQRSLMTDYITMRMMLLIITTWHQRTQLGGRGREEEKRRGGRKRE